MILGTVHVCVCTTPVVHGLWLFYVDLALARYVWLIAEGLKGVLHHVGCDSDDSIVHISCIHQFYLSLSIITVLRVIRLNHLFLPLFPMHEYVIPGEGE